ncbi:hypothetical protein [Cellulomonas bogoriensis]|uniref:Uncharacterized protein n=1 Tax=Cellulomonas bogoriensis 69B4 = DSM 16987 TaxID=1386082 RepID=A0A0A0BUV4_9CELL|nr:hypothetical protein [Cellulomonas bogoriensis]KGM10944.1 hypothetical protein N869_03825 [Cellulomonas bogoriensis 69B4 = DSM 16987]
MSRPLWDWEFLDAEGGQLDRPVSPAFTSRFDAETWLGDCRGRLEADGVAHARLAHRGTAVAAPVRIRLPDRGGDGVRA